MSEDCIHSVGISFLQTLNYSDMIIRKPSKIKECQKIYANITTNIKTKTLSENLPAHLLTKLGQRG
jgi:hypothetical protein